MDDNINSHGIPGYVSIKEAAEMLNLAPNTVYEYVTEGRLSSLRAAHVIMIPIEEVKKFKPNIAGRPRKSIPVWRISPQDNELFMTSITVRIRTSQQEVLMSKLEEIKQSGEYLFPGTIARYFTQSEKKSDYVNIALVWRGIVMPDEAAREEALQQFREALADVLDWDTAQYDTCKVLMHT